MGKVKNKNLILILLIFTIVRIIASISGIKNIFFNIEPIIWFLFGIYIFIKGRRYHKRFNNKNNYINKMILVTIVYFIIYFYLGFIIGYTNSPYSHTIISIVKNIFKIVLPIIAIEYVRSYICNKNNENYLIISLVTLLLILLEINISSLIYSASTREDFFIEIASNVLPIITMNILYTYLCLLGGKTLPLIYRISEKLIYILLPILPNVDWFVKASIGILLPATYYLLYRFVFIKSSFIKRKNKTNKLVLIICIIFSLLLVTFMLGFYKYEPVAIVSNSMNPMYYRGDVVIYEKLNEDDLKKIPKDSIIIYRIGNQQIAHRVVNVIQENGKIKYRTKGDSNNTNDEKLVAPEDIIGVYITRVKYIGYPSIWLSEFFSNEEAKVETK